MQAAGAGPAPGAACAQPQRCCQRLAGVAAPDVTHAVLMGHFSIPRQNIWGREACVPAFFLEGRIRYPIPTLLYQGLTGNTEV